MRLERQHEKREREQQAKSARSAKRKAARDAKAAEPDQMTPLLTNRLTNRQVRPGGHPPNRLSRAKPSDGLEPSTPSLPSRFQGNWSQPTANGFGLFGPFSRMSHLRAVATGCDR